MTSLGHNTEHRGEDLQQSREGFLEGVTSELRGEGQGVHGWRSPKGSASKTFAPLLSALADLINDNNDSGDNHRHSWNANDGLSPALN